MGVIHDHDDLLEEMKKLVGLVMDAGGQMKAIQWIQQRDRTDFLLLRRGVEEIETFCRDEWERRVEEATY